MTGSINPDKPAESVLKAVQEFNTGDGTESKEELQKLAGALGVVFKDDLGETFDPERLNTLDQALAHFKAQVQSDENIDSNDAGKQIDAAHQKLLNRATTDTQTTGTRVNERVNEAALGAMRGRADTFGSVKPSSPEDGDASSTESDSEEGTENAGTALKSLRGRLDTAAFGKLDAESLKKSATKQKRPASPQADQVETATQAEAAAPAKSQGKLRERRGAMKASHPAKAEAKAKAKAIIDKIRPLAKPFKDDLTWTGHLPVIEIITTALANTTSKDRHQEIAKRIKDAFPSYLSPSLSHLIAVGVHLSNGDDDKAVKSLKDWKGACKHEQINVKQSEKQLAAILPDDLKKRLGLGKRRRF